MNIARQRSLRHLEAALDEPPPQLMLAANRRRRYEFRIAVCRSCFIVYKPISLTSQANHHHDLSSRPARPQRGRSGPVALPTSALNNVLNPPHLYPTGATPKGRRVEGPVDLKPQTKGSLNNQVGCPMFAIPRTWVIRTGEAHPKLLNQISNDYRQRKSRSLRCYAHLRLAPVGMTRFVEQPIIHVPPNPSHPHTTTPTNA